ncbi:MAG: hypothetical protein Kow0042_20100 [Calditrichia bacterium]
MASDKNQAPIIYNLFPRLVGPFPQWEPHLRRAKRLHFNWIFINPIQQAGFSGSMYSIKDYYKIDSRYLDPDSEKSPEAQLKNLIDIAHQLGLKVMIDLVINHTAIDSVLVEQHPEWYKRDEAGKIVNPRAMDGDRVVAVWGDLAEIDNKNSPDRENLWRYWENLIDHFLNLGFDGFRCDAAYQVPASLWQRLIRFSRKRNPEAVFFAESLGCPFEQVIELGQAGFDFTFNSSKWWDFEAAWGLEQYEQNRLQAAPTVSFAESHDTERLAAEYQGNWSAVQMRYLFSVLFSTGVMMPIGFEFGFQKPLHVVRTRPQDWEKPSIDLQEFIRDANQLKIRYPVFAQESLLETVECGNPGVFAFRKISADNHQVGLVILNKDLQAPQQFRIKNLSEILERPQTTEFARGRPTRSGFSDEFEGILSPAEVIVMVGNR